MKKWFISFATIIALMPTMAIAENNSGLSKFMSDPVEQQHVLEAAKRSTVIIQNPCPSTDFKILDKFTPVKPIAFDSSGKIIDGAWKQVVSAKGCGDDRLLNVFLAMDANTKAMKIFPILPGTTHTDLILQKDAVKYAVTAAGGPEKGCNIGYISDTQFLQKVDKPMDGAKAPPWDELWTLVTCTKKAQVTMHFIPDKTGTTIAAGQPETKIFPIELKKPQQ